MGGASLIFPQEKFEFGLSHDFLREKNIKFSLSSEDANILKSSDMQYSKQAHEMLASSDKKNYYFFLRSR